MQLATVPELARHLVTALPEDFEFLAFSAIVYRYQAATAWLIDIAVFGLDDDDLDSELADMVVRNVRATVEEYNWEHHGILRFVLGALLLLNSEEQERGKPQRVTVRRYYRWDHARGVARMLHRAWRGFVR